jgi:hypothetical protein
VSALLRLSRSLSCSLSCSLSRSLLLAVPVCLSISHFSLSFLPWYRFASHLPFNLSPSHLSLSLLPRYHFALNLSPLSCHSQHSPVFPVLSPPTIHSLRIKARNTSPRGTPIVAGWVKSTREYSHILTCSSFSVFLAKLAAQAAQEPHPFPPAPRNRLGSHLLAMDPSSCSSLCDTRFLF